MTQKSTQTPFAHRYDVQLNNLLLMSRQVKPIKHAYFGVIRSLKEKPPEQETALDLNVSNLMRRSGSTTGVAGQCLFLVVYKNVLNKQM